MRGFPGKGHIVLLGAVFMLLTAGKDLSAQPFNDNPCQAIPLHPGINCVWQEFDNIGATNLTTGIPSPGCGAYTASEAQDVWFVLQVPSDGNVQIDQLPGTLNNTSMAAYTATTCAGPFTLIECDANDSPNGAMPYLSLTGLTPGSYLYLRVWDVYLPPNPFIGPDPVNPSEEGTFNICVEYVTGLFEPNEQPSNVTYDCGNTPPAGNTCETATPICAFDGYCGSTSGYSANYWYQGGNGLGGPLIAQGIFCGSIENNSFISFIASETEVELEVQVWGSGCYDGIQFMMFGDPTGAPACGSMNIVSYGCLYDENLRATTPSLPPASRPGSSIT